MSMWNVVYVQSRSSSFDFEYSMNEIFLSSNPFPIDEINDIISKTMNNVFEIGFIFASEWKWRKKNSLNENANKIRMK